MRISAVAHGLARTPGPGLGAQPAPEVGGPAIGGRLGAVAAMVMSLMTGRDSGFVIAVTSSMAHANTASLALRVGEVFAQQTR